MKGRTDDSTYFMTATVQLEHDYFYEYSCDCCIFILCSVFIVCVVLCTVFRLIVMLFCVICVVCVLCPIVVPLPPGENSFAVKIRNKNNNNIYCLVYRVSEIVTSSFDWA
jgi:uncharacterized membrane protein